MQIGSTIEELYLGKSAEMFKIILEEDVDLYGKITNDYSCIHFDNGYAAKTIFKKKIVHGLLIAGLLSGVIGMQLPGSGTIYEEQNIKFLAPVFFGDEIKAKVEVIEIDKTRNRVKLRTTCQNQNGKIVIDGYAIVLPPKK